MQMVKRALLLLIVLWLSIILFAPKQELYYLLEERLQNSGVILNETRIDENAMGLTLEKVTLYIQGVDLGKIKQIDLWTLLFYTRIDITAFTPSPGILKIADIRLKKAHFQYAVWNPEQIRIEVEGNIGKVVGSFDLKKHLLRLRWEKTGAIDPIKPYLKRDKKGWYYERIF